MKIVLPFPKCNSCKKDSPTSYHRNCGGKMYVETTTDWVSCDKCYERWYIWNSDYFCSCGHKFHASEVKSALTEVLAYCRVCADEVAEQQRAKSLRQQLTERSLRSFLVSFVEKIGYSLGVALGTIVETAIKFILG